MKIHCAHDELVRVTDLKPHPKNRNQHPEEQVTRLARILEFQGWRYPVKVSKRSGYVTSGHGRISAAKENGWEYVPVNFQDYESEEQEYADVTSDNAIASWAELDLAGINSDLADLGPDFDIDLLGIEGFVLEPADKHQGDPDDVPPVPEVATTKLGDLFSLGDHRLLCGDATSREDVERLMNGEKADMVFTDPPYGVAYVGIHEGIHEGIHGAGTHRRKELDNDDTDDLIKKVPKILEDCCDGPVYLFCGPGKEVGLLNAINQTSLERISVLIWNKPKGSFALNANYKPSFEMFFYMKTRESDRRWAGSHKEWTVWDLAKEGENKLHPTQKPVELVQKAIQNHTAKSVLDLFLGSGSTLIACEKTNRRCFGMEIDPLYCDVIIKRWETYAGKKAVLIEKAG